MESVIYSIQSDKIIPLVISNIVTDTLFVSARPLDHEALSANHEFKESIKFSREWPGLWLEYMKTQEKNCSPNSSD